MDEPVIGRSGKAAGGCPSPLSCGSCVALRATSPAVLARVAPSQNSLRSLRSLRSDSCDEFVHVARCARGPRELRSSAPQMRAAGHPPTALREPHVLVVRSRREAGIEPASRRAPQARVMPARGLDAGEAASFAKRCRWTAKTWAGGGRSASAAPRSAGLAGSARSAPRELTRRSCPSVASAANAASSATARKSEHRRGRGPQGHARAAAKRSPPPARGFARDGRRGKR